jgi:hypothetical protein
MLRRVLIVLLLLGSSAASAKPVLTAVCDSPVGFRYKYLHGTVEKSDDSFTGVKPTFVLDDSKQGKLLVIFGSTQTSDKPAWVTTGADEATLVTANGLLVSAVISRPDAIETFALFPQERVLFYTKQERVVLLDKSAQIATMYAKCDFNLAAPVTKWRFP